MIKNKKGALEFSFAWIFAIIAGMFILFLAIYGVTKFMNLEGSTRSAETAMDIGVLTNPLESSFETGKRSLMTTSIETRIYTECDNVTISNFFGKQIIGVSEETYNKWSDEETHSFPNKYIFSDNPVQGKNFYLFSKPFELPFKVADLIYLTSTNDKYCFKDSPLNIKNEIEGLTGLNPSENENFFTKSCPTGSINICFKGGAKCDIEVNTNSKSVKKGGETMYYEGDALMYAAIFSKKDIYECQVKRLMKRTGELADIYGQKSTFVLRSTGCNSGLSGDLLILKDSANSFANPQNILIVSSIADEINTKNQFNTGECRLW